MSVPEQEIECFKELAKEMNEFIKLLLKMNPILRKDWETQDFEQELALKYFRNLAEIAHTLKEGDHRLNLLRKMARQLAIDKLRSLQRQKRDIKKINDSPIDALASKEEPCVIELKEIIENVKLKAPEKVWTVIELRNQGKTWQECCDDVQYISPAALRAKIARFVEELKM